jgi:uncharacterized protein
VDGPFSHERIQGAYDVAADDYEKAFGNDLARLPLDCHMLDRLKDAAGGGPILDLGCGTGSAGSYLRSHGAQVLGLDLSIGMLSAGRRSSMRFAACQGDMRRLPFREQAFVAVVAFYSVDTVIRAELQSVLAEAARVLVPQGTLLVATHLGEGEVYTDEFLGHEIVTTGGTLYSEQQFLDLVSSSCFKVQVSQVREPLAHEHASQRIYLMATRT